jgi:two-component system nitrogen regulation sensor histidine kinase NtrY
VHHFTAEWKSMVFNWKHPVMPRMAILVASILAFSFLLVDSKYLLSLIALGIIAFQIKQLIELIDASEKNITPFLDSIKFDDQSASFKTESNDPTVQRLHKELNDAIIKLRNARQEKDSEYLFYKNIVMHVGIGLIIFKEETGKIEIFNSAARKLLKINRAESVQDLKEVSETLVNVFMRLRTGGRELIQLKLGEDIIQLSIYAIELTLRGENLKLISIQNIQSELEEKEMEAWQNLVRVLTHEIMNSVTPISSLAGTLDDELRGHLKGETDKPLSKDQMDDLHLSLQTISKRSEGLIHFVKEFRSLTHIPKPKPVSIRVCTLFEEVAMLHRKEAAEKNIKLEFVVEPEDLSLMADKTMTEQVLINLLKNALQSFEEQENKTIILRGYYNDKMRPIISVKDNGTGIDPEALDKIFIPFFTTKKTGSGIGLSLSRQFMRQHQGTLTVKSTVGKGTEFFMRF